MVQKCLNRDFFGAGENICAGFYMEQREFHMHSHEFWEISYVFEGRGTHHFENGGTAPIGDGEFVFVSPGTAHCITSQPAEKGSPVRVCNLLMTQEYMDRLAGQLRLARETDEFSMRRMISQSEKFCVLLKDDSGSVYRFMMTAAHEYKHFSDCSGEIIDHSAAGLLLYLARLYERTVNGETATSTKNERIDELIKYIQSNFGSRITLEYLAEYAHLTPEYLSRYFKKVTGKNLSEFIAEVRIEKAKYRLRTSSWPVSQVCEYCGYGSESNFQKAFRKMVGMSAGEYRKSFQKKEHYSNLKD